MQPKQKNNEQTVCSNLLRSFKCTVAPFKTEGLLLLKVIRFYFTKKWPASINLEYWGLPKER